MTSEPDRSTDKTKTLRLPCANCDGETVHAVLKEVEQDQSSPDVQVYYEFQIVQCGGCENISFRKNWTSSEDIYPDPITGNICAEDHPELFPSRIAGRRELKSADVLPLKILALYRETHHALCYRLGILAGIGIRGLVEAVCKEKAAKGKNLEEQIDALVGLGLMTKEGAEILHGTRLLGNEAAHEAEPVPEKHLDAAMDVVEHLLTGIFILPKKAEGLPRRASASAPTGP